MINTKLILVDGIFGSGKSTIAHFIARQIAKNGIKVRWFYEEEKNHPLSEIGKNIEESEEDHSKRVLSEYPQKWVDFVNKIKDDEYTYIVESYLFQDVLFSPHFMNDIDKRTIKEYSHKLLEISRCLNPVLIHLYQQDVRKPLIITWQRRGEEWTSFYMALDESTLYCKNRNLNGEAAVIQLWQDFTDFTVELFQEYNFKKLQIENSAQDWITYRKQILDFLELPFVEEKLFDSSYSRFCGEYFGCGEIFKIHVNNNRLCLDAFWLNLKLLPVSENQVEMEGFPITFKFYRYGGKKKIKLVKSDCYYKKGSILNEYKSFRISEKKLGKFCGIYWCEDKKLERKLYLKNGKFYYWREEAKESLIIPITDTQFQLIIDVDNRIDFIQVDGKWHFTLDLKGNKPSFSLFVKKDMDQKSE